jgi:hypothetical protein
MYVLKTDSSRVETAAMATRLTSKVSKIFPKCKGIYGNHQRLQSRTTPLGIATKANRVQHA